MRGLAGIYFIVCLSIMSMRGETMWFLPCMQREGERKRQKERGEEERERGERERKKVREERNSR